MRSAWISFAGRIVAQVLGAVATVVLGVYVITQVNDSSTPSGVPSRTAAPKPRPAAGEAALAVLPFDNFSADRQSDYLVDGLSEALIADLSQIRGIKVISRTSSMHYKGAKRPVTEIGQELGVDLVVEGSAARSGDRVRVTAQLIDATQEGHIWARTYERTIADVLALQQELASAIAAEVRGVVPGVTVGAATVRRAVDAGAYDLYLRGRHAWNRRTPDGFREAHRYFQQAIEREPGFALAYAGLADTYQLASEPLGGSAGAAPARAAAERALQIDDTLAEAHTTLGAIQHRSEGNVEEAEQSFRRALQLHPGYATAYQWYAILLAEEGRDAEALRHARRAVELDPLSGAIHQTLGLVHYYGHRFDHAIVATRRALELVPQLGLARQTLARALTLSGSPRETIELLTTGTTAGQPELMATLALADLKAGNSAEAERIHRELQDRTPRPLGALAWWYAASGNDQRALSMLAALAAERPTALRQLKAEPVFDRLRTHPGFVRLVAPVGAAPP